MTKHINGVGTDFCFTGEKYKKLTGVDLPQSNHYIMQKSALANWIKRKK